MAEQMVEKVVVPEGTQMEISGNDVKFKAAGKENARHFKSTGVVLRKSGNGIEVWAKSGRKNIVAQAKAVASHIRNLIDGLKKPYEYKLEVVFSHFPLNIRIKDKVIEIYNLAGAKFPRKARIMGDVKVEIKGKDITVKGHNKEHVGQTAANMEQATKVKGKDIRVFQDRIYITSKGKAA